MLVLRQVAALSRSRSMSQDLAQIEAGEQEDLVEPLTWIETGLNQPWYVILTVSKS